LSLNKGVYLSIYKAVTHVQGLNHDTSQTVEDIQLSRSADWASQQQGITA